MGKCINKGFLQEDDPIFSEGVQMFSTQKLRRPKEDSPSDEPKLSTEDMPERPKYVNELVEALKKATLEDKHSDKGES